MRKRFESIKRRFAVFLIVTLSIKSFAAVVSDNDGSAFITKSEFDALRASFQSQIDTYNNSIDSKIDGAIASYLAGIKIAEKPYAILSCLTAHKDKKNNTGTILFVGTNNKRWFYSGTAIYDNEKYKGAWNQKPYLQKDVWVNIRSSAQFSEDISTNQWPPEYQSAVQYEFHAKWRNNDNRYGAMTHESALILLDDNDNAVNFRANPRIDFTHMFDRWMYANSNIWQPMAFPKWDDGTIGTLNLNQLPDEMFYGQNTHNAESYISWSENNETNGLAFRQQFGRWGSNSSYPEFMQIRNPADGSMQSIGMVKSGTTYHKVGTDYWMYKSAWTVSFNTQYGDGFGVYIPSGMKTDTKCFAVHDWPSTDLLTQSLYEFRFGRATSSVPDYDASATSQHWIHSSTSGGASQQMLGGFAAHVANATRIYSDVNIKGYFPEYIPSAYKDLRNVNDAQIYDQLGEECALAGCPILYEPLDQAGTIEWKNIKFSNGLYASGVSAGNFTVLFNKNKFVESDINASDQVNITTPKPFKYRLHGQPAWSAEVTSLQPTKGSGYDFQFEVAKNEKIYFGVFDNANLLTQSIVVQEPDADSMTFQPAID